MDSLKVLRDHLNRLGHSTKELTSIIKQERASLEGEDYALSRELNGENVDARKGTLKNAWQLLGRVMEAWMKADDALLKGRIHDAQPHVEEAAQLYEQAVNLVLGRTTGTAKKDTPAPPVMSAPWPTWTPEPKPAAPKADEAKQPADKKVAGPKPKPEPALKLPVPATTATDEKPRTQDEPTNRDTAAILAAIKAGQEECTTRFNGVDKRLDGLNGRVQDIEMTVASLRKSGLLPIIETMSEDELRAALTGVRLDPDTVQMLNDFGVAAIAQAINGSLDTLNRKRNREARVDRWRMRLPGDIHPNPKNH